MNIKKITGSIGVIALVGTVVAAGTGAFFTDTEVSQGNIFTAGAINIEISNITHTGVNVSNEEVGFSVNNDAMSFSFADLKPLDHGKVSFDLENKENPAFVCVMVEETGNAENGRNEAEKAVGDTTAGNPGNGNGELGQFLSFKFGSATGTLQAISGTWQNLGTGVIGTNATSAAVLEYGFGDFDGGTVIPSTAGDVNLAQTDSLAAKISFQAVQARHNADFDCADLNLNEDNPTDPTPADPVTNTVGQNDLATTPEGATDGKWFFYNDSDDTFMTQNQFSGNGGINEITSAGAHMVLDGSITNPRYNIATYKYSNIPLSSITTLKYTVTTVGTASPFLNFNISFDGNDTWQRRLASVTGPLTAGTHTFDVLAQGFTYSGSTWPAGGSELGTTPGTTAKTWASILADYPSAKISATTGGVAGFLGIRNGQPGPVGSDITVKSVQFNGEVTNFQ